MATDDLGCHERKSICCNQSEAGKSFYYHYEIPLECPNMLLEVEALSKALSTRPLLVGRGEDILSLKVEGTRGGSEDLLLVPPP